MVAYDHRSDRPAQETRRVAQLMEIAAENTKFCAPVCAIKPSKHWTLSAAEAMELLRTLAEAAEDHVCRTSGLRAAAADALG